MRSRAARVTFHLRLADRPSRPSPLFRDELFSLTPADLLCYPYAMVNRQDATYSPRSPESGRHLLPAEINLTERNYAWWCTRHWIATGGINCLFLDKLTIQNCSRDAYLNTGTSNSARYLPAFALSRHMIRLFGFESSVGRQSGAIGNATGIDPVESLIEVCSARHKIRSQVVRLGQVPRVVRLMQASSSATCCPAASGLST